MIDMKRFYERLENITFLKNLRVRLENRNLKNKIYNKRLFAFYAPAFVYGFVSLLIGALTAKNVISFAYYLVYGTIWGMLSFFYIYGLIILLSYKVKIQEVVSSLKKVSEYLKEGKPKESIDELDSNTALLITNYLGSKEYNNGVYSKRVGGLLKKYILSITIPLLESRRSQSNTCITNFIGGLQADIEDTNPSKLYDRIKKLDEGIRRDKGLREDLALYYRLDDSFFEAPLYSKIEKIKPPRGWDIIGLLYMAVQSPLWEKIPTIIIALSAIYIFLSTGKPGY